ncbi:hypothetical protein DU508_17255 [Pedobacter chinensis]|uniref:Endonuclease I n=2 Tax=Sphingobacteriaceae TaxID=84566 RepID=A0A369PST9_9SPHI|nr:endonuclease [Pedobacter chinensis]PZP49430.1 MAG: hypothetical protein DI598_07850 [Pseudopedobacter saltans]RDC55320.1 hypothetical protein DU508_17255 [Pedobacter chinensis]
MLFLLKNTTLYKNFNQSKFSHFIKVYAIYVLILIPFLSTAQIPSYYSGINFTLTGNDLKQELSLLIITTHTNILPYTSSTMPDVWDALKQSDLDPANSGNVLLIYGWNDTDAIVDNDRTRDKNLSCHTSSCTGKWVREHTYPRSLGTPNLGFENAGADAHHLRPIDDSRNGTRSNNKFTAGSGRLV